MIYEGVLDFLETIDPGHANRVSGLTFQLAQAIGLPEHESKLIAKATRYHDIGKIAVPFCILTSSNKLTERELELTRRHVDYGVGLLSVYTGPLMKMARTIIATHHERFDGSGYPKGLKGEAIPLCGRIVSICDVFDALVSQRTYKEPWPLDKTLSYIRESSGILFDPQLVKPFLACVEGNIEQMAGEEVMN